MLACLGFVPLLAFEDELRSPGLRFQYEDWRPGAEQRSREVRTGGQGAEQRGEEHLDTDSIVTCRNVSEHTSKM